MRKSFIIIGIIALVITIGAGGYFTWRFLISPRNSIPSTNVIPQAAEVVQFVPQSRAEKVFDYWFNKKTGEIYYFFENGDIYKISSNGESEMTGSRATGSLSYIKPSTDGSLILVSFGYPQNPTFAIHNTASKTWQALPAETVAASWDPASNNRLVYLKNNGGVSRLNLYTVSDGKSKEVLKLSQKDLDVEWIIPEEIYLKERISARTSSSIWSFNLKTGVIRTLIKDEVTPMIKWSLNGEVGIKWTGNLSLINKSNRQLANINLSTFPSKCVFSTNTLIYCAVPVVFNPPPGLLDDYLNKGLKTSDDLYLIDLENLEKGQSSTAIIFTRELADFDIDADHLETFNDRLYFLNRHDKKLYGLEL